MATRSTITIQGDSKQVHLYRHWDGYPEMTGRHLAWAARDADSVEDMIIRLLTAKEGEKHGSGRYQITDNPEAHSDREWHYEITFGFDGQTHVRMFERPIGEAIRLNFEGTLPAYRKMISGKFRAFVARVKLYNRGRAA